MQHRASANAPMICELHDLNASDLAAGCAFPEAAAVLVGNNPGWVFADDLNTPRSLMVWAQGIEGFYLIGDSENAAFLREIDGYIDRELKPRLLDLGVTWFEVSGDVTWNPVTERVFARRSLVCSQQWVYTAEPTRRGSVTQSGPADDCLLLRVGQSLLANLAVTNREFLFSKLFRFWDGVDAFLGHGAGYLILCGQEIASLCLSGFVVGDLHVVDIETKASHQRRGHATLVAQAFIAECADRRFQLRWDCMAENTASARLAEKLGFTRSDSYTLYGFPLQR